MTEEQRALQAHLHTVNASQCDECPVLENRNHDIAYLEAEIVTLKDALAEKDDHILILEHQVRRPRIN